VKTLRHVNYLHLRSILHSRKLCANIARRLGNEMEIIKASASGLLNSTPLHRLSTAVEHNLNIDVDGTTRLTLHCQRLDHRSYTAGLDQNLFRYGRRRERAGWLASELASE